MLDSRHAHEEHKNLPNFMIFVIIQILLRCYVSWFLVYVTTLSNYRATLLIPRSRVINVSWDIAFIKPSLVRSGRRKNCDMQITNSKDPLIFVDERVSCLGCVAK